MRKIITLSFDDGEVQDIRLIELLKKYGLQATFYLCSAHIGLKIMLPSCRYVEKVDIENIRQVYDGFEIGSHAENHQGLIGKTKEEIREFIQKDIDIFSPHTDKPIVCFAYPGGQTDEGVVKNLRDLGIIKFARAIPNGEINFNYLEESMNIIPQAHIFNDNVYDIIDEFEKINNDRINILHIYGHSYEMDIYENGWERIERLFKRLSQLVCEKLCNGQAYEIAFWQ